MSHTKTVTFIFLVFGLVFCLLIWDKKIGYPLNTQSGDYIFELKEFLLSQLCCSYKEGETWKHKVRLICLCGFEWFDFD